MEAYKHSCPFCGQHIEYTVEYCGTQITCPTCGKSVTFPAIPPGGKKEAPRVKRTVAMETAAKGSFNLQSITVYLREFEHWNVVLICLVPFVVVGGLLIGSAVLRKNAGEGPALPEAPRLQADPNAWSKMTELTKADTAVREQLGAVNRAYNAVAAAKRNVANLQIAYQGRPVDPTVNTDLSARNSALAAAQQNLNAAQRSFDAAFGNYVKLGGTINYRAQLPQ
jgi:hypothetical protein